jgi:hypothetical protein
MDAEPPEIAHHREIEVNAVCRSSQIASVPPRNR